MLSLSSVLGTLVAKYHKSIISGNRESRVLVPGLTELISMEVHSYLIEQGITSYLVIGDDLVPDSSKNWISPIGLTSKRQGSFVAVVRPGQLSHIQDSIRGSGGTIRSVAFSEEWPWVDEGSEVFNFSGTFIFELVKLWSTKKEEQAWLVNFIKELVPSTSSFSEKTSFLLEELLGRFSPSLYPELSDIRLKMLFHVGLPKPTTLLLPVSKLFIESSRLCEKIVERCRNEDGLRHVIIERVENTIPVEECSIIKHAVHSLLDGIGQSRTLDLGALTFWNCWGRKPEYWNALGADALASIFNLKTKETAGIKCLVSLDRGIVSEKQNFIATFLGELVNFAGTYEIPEDQLTSLDWELKLTFRGKVLHQEKLTDSSGEYAFTLDTNVFTSKYSKSVSLKVVLFADGTAHDDHSIRLHLCGDQRQSFAIIDTRFDVIDAKKGNEESPDFKAQIDSPVHIFLMTSHASSPVLLDADQNEHNLIQTGMPGIWRTGSKVDPSDEPTGQALRICRFEDSVAVICLESKDIEKGEFTIEDELRLKVAGIREKNIADLMRLFAGSSRDPFRQLGMLNDATRRKIKIANDFSGERGWRPILMDLFDPAIDNVNLIGNYILSRGRIVAPGFSDLEFPADALGLLLEYSRTRFELITTVKESLELGKQSLEHPIYATHPVYVDSNKVEIEKILASYLSAYCKILEYIALKRETLEWSQIFVLSCLDCVVNWNDSETKNSFFLIGPWHPLVIAKRFMVQRALFQRAQRLTENDEKEFRHLSPLLSRIPGFRWLWGLHGTDSQLERLYSIPTSDPGWHVAFKENLIGAVTKERLLFLSKIFSCLNENLGIETSSLEDESSSGVASNCIQSFMKAYPGRRSLGIRVRKGYPTIEILPSLDNLLHNEDGASEIGKILPGGIHFFAEEKIPTTEGLRPITPPLLMYHVDNDVDYFQGFNPDIYFLPPSKSLEFRPVRNKISVPRGVGFNSVFYEPLFLLTEGQSQLPSTICFEIDSNTESEGSVGHYFSKLLTTICSAFETQMGVLRSVDLPVKLECPWAVAPGGGADPAVFVKYVRDGAAKSIQERALWDYRIDISGSRNSFYIMSTIPKGLSVAINGFFGNTDTSGSFVGDLGTTGIAIGGEALRSGRHALGVIGLVGAIRLFIGIGGSGLGAFKKNESAVGFLIPIDSFSSFFAKAGNQGRESDENNKRADLMAIQLFVPVNSEGLLEISACGVEAKFISGTFPQQRAGDALLQAQSSASRFSLLVQSSLKDGGIPERLALISIIKFGLRIASPNRQDERAKWVEIEEKILTSLLAGKYIFKKPSHDAVLVSTEGGLSGVCEPRYLSSGLWIRINKENWPGISDSSHLEGIRKVISKIFSAQGESSGGSANFGNSPPPAPPSSDPRGIGDNSPTTLGNPPSHSPLHSALPIPNPKVSGNTPSASFIQNFGDELSQPKAEAALRRILVGVDDARRPLFFDPQSQIDPLDNLNFMITGSSGTGKTQFLKYLICKFREQNKNILILDFKNDFASDSAFIEKANLTRAFVSFDGLPFNPLIPYPVSHPGTGQRMYQVAQHISGIAAVLKRTYKLGTQQQMAVKNAIVEAFSRRGIQTSGHIAYDPNINFPDLSDVGSTIQETNPNAYNRLDPLFTLDLFRPESRGNSFHELVNQSLVLDLSQIPNDEIKNTLAELLILSAHAYYNALPHSGVIRQFIVFDEAHRVLDSDYMTNLVRECRAYGVGAVLSSQYPTDFPAGISSSMASKVMHGNGRDSDRVRAIVNLIGAPEREPDVSGLVRFQAFLDNRHHPHTLMRTMNYPLYIIASQLVKCGETTIDELSKLPGLDTNKLSIGNLISEMEKLGIISEKSGLIRYIDKE